MTWAVLAPASSGFLLCSDAVQLGSKWKGRADLCIYTPRYEAWLIDLSAITRTTNGAATMKDNLRIGLGLSAITIILAVLGGTSALAAVPPPGLSVTVTNTPLPVTVTNATTNQSVTVTNSADSPVRTAEAFVRTSVRIQLAEDAHYVVPAGFRLVVETASLELTCPITHTGATGGLLLQHADGTGSLTNFRLYLVLQSQGSVANASLLNASQSVRFSLDPGDQLAQFAECNPDSTNATLNALVLGYLVSVNSPSLAP